MGRKPKCIEEDTSSVITNVSADDVCRLVEEKCGIKPKVHRGSEKHTVVFTPQGLAELYQVTGFGLVHPSNKLESQYVPFGYYFADTEGKTTTVICHVLPLQSARRAGSAAAVCADGDVSAWKIMDEQEKLLQKYSSNNYDAIRKKPINPFLELYGPVRRVGFGHTHPGLTTFWSATDRTSVFAANGDPWTSLVVDPHNMLILAGVGPKLTKPNLILYDYARGINTSMNNRSNSRYPSTSSSPRIPFVSRKIVISSRLWYMIIQAFLTGVVVIFMCALLLLILAA